MKRPGVQGMRKAWMQFPKDHILKTMSRYIRIIRICSLILHSECSLYFILLPRIKIVFETALLFLVEVEI